MLVDWFERAGKGHFTGEEALARWDEWAHKRPRDYQTLINPGAVDTIRELPRRGVRVALASSSPMDSIEEVLNACGLSDAFEYVVSGEQFKESKPEPDIYLHALDLLGLPANRCCCVEDSVPGVQLRQAEPADRSLPSARSASALARMPRTRLSINCRSCSRFLRSVVVARFSGLMSKCPTFWCVSKHTLC